MQAARPPCLILLDWMAKIIFCKKLKPWSSALCYVFQPPVCVQICCAAHYSVICSDILFCQRDT
jgi:hypothetical protein